MKQQFPFPISEETLQPCWEYMDRRRRHIRVRSITAKFGGFLSNLVFLFCLLFSVNGLILRHFSGSYCFYLRELSFFMGPWKKVSTLLIPGASLESDLVRLLLLSYLAAIAVFLIVFLLDTALYHPRKRSVPQEPYPESAQQLAALTKEAWAQTFKTHISSSVVSILLLIIAAFVLFFGYTFYLEDATIAQSLLSRFPTSDMGTNSVLYVFFAYILGHFLCLPVVLLTRPLYYSRLDYDLVANAEAAALFAGEPTEGMTEDAILQRRRDNAAPLREEAIHAEEKNGYRIAKELFLKAALGGDVPAMEHYARHCLLDHRKAPARYWLDKAAASGEISPEGKNMRWRLKLGMNLNVGYLQEGVDSSLKATRRRAILQMVKNILSLVVFLGLAAAVLVAAVRYFGGDEASLMADLKEIFGVVTESISAEDPFGETEETTPANVPLQTLSEAGTPWEGKCIAYDDAGTPMVSCYGQDQGGSLTIPYSFPEGQQLRSASVYFGNVWDVRVITKHVSYDSEAQAVVIGEDYLQGLEPGEYFILLNNGEHYIPLLVRSGITPD